MTIQRSTALLSVLRVLVVLLALWESSAALAQTPGAPRGTSLFGGSSTGALANPRSLDLIVSLSSAHDDDLSGAQGSPALPFETRFGGRYADLDASLSLVQMRPRFGVVARAAGSLRRYRDLGSFMGSSKSAVAALTANLSRHTTVRASIDANDVSSFAFDTFARRSLEDSGLFQAGLGEVSLNRTTTSHGGIAELTQTLGRHSSLGFTYGVRHSESPVFSERNDERTGAGRFERAAGRDSSVRVEYTVRHGTQAVAAASSPIWSHDVQFGFERQWRHSTSRRTVISFAAGPSVLEGSVLQGDDRIRLLRLVGTFDLDHQMGQTWSARLSYRRGGGLRDALAFSSTAALDVRGQMGRRVELVLSAGYFDRDFGLAKNRGRVGTAFGTARLQVALARFVALYGQGLLDHYDYGTFTPWPEGHPRQWDRRGLRAGVTLWGPLQR